ncbi:uncharacterized protein [Primulina huaijiensis]|uniref:uncharacterized protein isoform X2 n=1 Tax=Primulina huaijiensis TaxID=1492673 RepID=UPI003CC77C26
MWNFASGCLDGKPGIKIDPLKPTQDLTDCSDGEVSSAASREEELECPICWESFNLVENVPYVLWCGHTLCKNCILGLQWAVVKCPTLPLQLPLFISCPWCNLFSFRLVYRGNLKFPRKNFFLLWMLESMNGDRAKSDSIIHGDHQMVCPSSAKTTRSYIGNNNRRRQHMHHSEPLESSHDDNNFNGYLDVFGLADEGDLRMTCSLSIYLGLDEFASAQPDYVFFILDLTRG